MNSVNSAIFFSSFLRLKINFHSLKLIRTFSTFCEANFRNRSPRRKAIAPLKINPKKVAAKVIMLLIMSDGNK